MSDVKEDLQTAAKDAEAALLAKVNAEKSWLRSSRPWLIALAIGIALGFIVAHVIKP